MNNSLLPPKAEAPCLAMRPREAARALGVCERTLWAWTQRGDVPHVVFTCANPVVDGTVYVYYGGADHVIALATAPLDDLIDFALAAKT